MGICNSVEYELVGTVTTGFFPDKFSSSDRLYPSDHRECKVCYPRDGSWSCQACHDTYVFGKNLCSHHPKDTFEYKIWSKELETPGLHKESRIYEFYIDPSGNNRCDTGNLVELSERLSRNKWKHVLARSWGQQARHEYDSLMTFNLQTSDLGLMGQFNACVSEYLPEPNVTPNNNMLDSPLSRSTSRVNLFESRSSSRF
jgi:hypothetical protein